MSRFVIEYRDRSFGWPTRFVGRPSLKRTGLLRSPGRTAAVEDAGPGAEREGRDVQAQEFGITAGRYRAQEAERAAKR